MKGLFSHFCQVPCSMENAKDNLADLFVDSMRSIEAEYSRLQHSIGWRFRMGPRATLSANTQIALLSLDPG